MLGYYTLRCVEFENVICWSLIAISHQNAYLHDSQTISPAIYAHYYPFSYAIYTVFRGIQNQGLLHLSQSANKCKTVLEEHLELARRVVHLSELSRRLETIQEQVRT